MSHSVLQSNESEKKTNKEKKNWKDQPGRPGEKRGLRAGKAPTKYSRRVANQEERQNKSHLRGNVKGGSKSQGVNPQRQDGPDSKGSSIGRRCSKN